jgi:hypothetical protein
LYVDDAQKLANAMQNAATTSILISFPSDDIIKTDRHGCLSNNATHNSHKRNFHPVYTHYSWMTSDTCSRFITEFAMAAENTALTGTFSFM